MLNIIKTITIIAFGLSSVSCANVPDEDVTVVKASDNTSTEYTSKQESLNVRSRLECPKPSENTNSMIVVTTDEDGIYGTNYFIEWDCDKRAQRWTAYELYKANLVKNVSRSGDYAWHEEDQIPNEYRSTYDDYHYSGFDRGHMCPSADRLCSSSMNKQTFCYCNMHPQVNGLNAGMWMEMESKVRTWAASNQFCDTLYVVKGGTIADDQVWSQKSLEVKGIGEGVVVPKYFFMALLAVKDGAYKALGFWIEHTEGKWQYSDDDRAAKNMKNYVVSIDQLETFTGIDFFYNLDDATEEAVESETNMKTWGFTSK